MINIDSLLECDCVAIQTHHLFLIALHTLLLCLHCTDFSVMSGTSGDGDVPDETTAVSGQFSDVQGPCVVYM